MTVTERGQKSHVSSPGSGRDVRLQIFATNLPRFVSDFAAIPNHWREHGLAVRVYVPMPEEHDGVWWANRDVIARSTSRLANGVELSALPVDRHTAGLRTIVRSFRWASAIARESPRDVFMFWAVPPSIMLGSPFRIRNRRCVFMLTGLGSIFGALSVRNRILRPIAAQLLGHLLRGKNSRAITHNQEDKAYFVERHGIDPAHITVTGGCGVSPDEFRFTPLPLNSPPVILVPVRLLREKGVYEAAEASGRLTERNVAHEMWFSHTADEGNPHPLTSSEIENLEGKYENVRFIGYQPHMAPVFKRCDIVCVPTWYREGLPTALLEAAATGRPIVTTDNIGGREFIKNGENGFLVPPRDPHALANALEQLLANPSLAEWLRQRAYRDYRAGYTKRHMLGRTLDVISSLGVQVPPLPHEGLNDE